MEAQQREGTHGVRARSPAVQCGVQAVLPGTRVPLVPARADPTWKAGPFIPAHRCLASAWCLESILGRDSDDSRALSTSGRALMSLVG